MYLFHYAPHAKTKNIIANSTEMGVFRHVKDSKILLTEKIWYKVTKRDTFRDRKAIY